ncbi:MAG: VanZ family protein [Thiobacillus sp.]|nr:VanZ family protein [Thiobacillus sp.]
MSRNVEPFDTPCRLLWLAALSYTAFVIYGSLVPLDFHALPWDEAVARFRDIPFLKLGIGSRADWVANLLLFIPLTFLWMGALSAGRSSVRGALATLAVIPAATALSLGIEFTQLYFPQRTVSQNDIFAETLGGLIGVLVWWGTGRRFVDWLQSWQHTHSRAALAERLAWVYLAGVLVYNVLPLDLTISLVEIFHKWQSGKVNLIPFGRLPDDAAYALYEIATDALIWAPLALLWRLDGTRSTWQAWGMTVAAAAMLEMLQLFVYSRVSDVTDVLTAILGAAVGAILGKRLATDDHQKGEWRGGPTIPNGGKSALLPLTLALVWVGVLMVVFWYPFNFQADAVFIKSRLELLQRVPFEAYYFGTEYRAITEVLHKILFLMPLGGLLAWACRKLPWRWRGPFFGLAMLMLVGVPVLIEVGQLLLPDKIADLTDAVLSWLGGLLGYWAARRLLLAPVHVDGPLDRAVDSHATPETRSPPRWHLPLSFAVMTCIFWVAARAPFMPYNVRELLRQESALLSAFLLAVACWFLAAWPVWLARRRISGALRLIQLPFGAAFVGSMSYLLVHAAVPEESMHDLVGSPILDWPGSWELALRWVALALVPTSLIYLAAQTVRGWRGFRLGALHYWAAFPPLLIGYWAVVPQAATDNLVELIATPKPLASLALAVWMYTLFLTAAAWASPWPSARSMPRLAGTILSFPLAALLLHLGLAGSIDKYGQEFSALQFLLSVDRQHYASLPTIWLRYAMLHGLVIAALASIQWPYFSYQLQRPRPSHEHH